MATESSDPVTLCQLGKNGPKVPAIGLGTANLAGIYGAIPSEEGSFAILDRALELGNVFWDTADVYGFNDELLAKWFAQTGARSKIFLASKFGIVMERGTTNFKGIDSSGEHCKKACNEMLERLGVDNLDLFYAHRINPKTPIEETVRAMAELKAEGKIKHIGLCGVSSSTLRRAMKVAPIACVQTEYSPFVRSIETSEGTDLLQTCRELGVAVVASSPLSRGLLTARFNSELDLSHEHDIRSKQMPRFHADNIVANAKVAAGFAKLAEDQGCSAAQLALAWILKQGDDIFVLPGTTKVKCMEENWKAGEIVLSDNKEKEVRDFVEIAKLQGDPETAAGMMFAFVNTVEEAS